jgi:hypothetical protein
MKTKRVIWEYSTGGYGVRCPEVGCIMTGTAIFLTSALGMLHAHTLRTHDLNSEPTDQNHAMSDADRNH